VRSEQTYLPAAGHDWLLPLYDPLTRLLGAQKARRMLLAQARLLPYERVLDVGCGTSALAVMIKEEHPSVDVVGVDPDPRALARAQAKADKAGLQVRFDHGFAETLPYRDGTFDRVFSSMMFHHIEPDARERALGEVHRVLKSGGRLELVDFEAPEGGSHGLLSRLLHSHHRLKDNSPRRMIELMQRAGFREVRKMASRTTLFGRIAFYQATAV
jgi:ubiquinone/menaquinone biosynthesis C-methylase UbiE